MPVAALHDQLMRLGSPAGAGGPARAERLRRFFKTKPGSYGASDQFLGVPVPELRRVAKAHADLARADLAELLDSPFNEERLVALLILRIQYAKADHEGKREIVDFYLRQIPAINNWNLVDLSAPYILGDFAAQTDTALLFPLAASENMWARRIAIVATQALIRKGHYDTTLQLAAQFLNETEDLMHKATGWMLREVGKRDERLLCAFLNQHKNAMPRTMLRHAIERLAPEQRAAYMKRGA